MEVALGPNAIQEERVIVKEVLECCTKLVGQWPWQLLGDYVIFSDC